MESTWRLGRISGLAIKEGHSSAFKELGEKYGFRTEILEKEKYKDKDISSTYIREELDQDI